MRLLVTGGAGFIGSNFIRYVLANDDLEILVCLDCLTYAGHLENLAEVTRHPKFKFARVDLRDKTKVLDIVREHGITHVVHLAAESHVDRSIHSPGDFIHTNVVGTFHLLEACRICWLSPGDGTFSGKVQETIDSRFLHVSTDEVFGSLGPKGLFNENSPYAPNSPYSASKAAADMLVRAYYQTYGLPVLTTNSTNNYGPYQLPEKLIPAVIQCLVDRRPIPLYGDGSNIRDWIHVDDHAEVLWELLKQGRVGERYLIGANEERSNAELVESLCDLVDELRPQWGGHSRKLIQLVRDRPGHDWRYAIDASKIQRELGWKPKRTFQEGLRATVEWYLNHQDWIDAVANGEED